MKRNTLNKWLKIIGITFLFVMSISIFSTHAESSTLEVASSSIVGLEQGGSGLTIPTGSATISSGIVQDRTFGALVIDIINYFLGFLGFLATLMFIYAGVLMVVNSGVEEMITKAKTIMTYASLGLIVILLSFAIVKFITSSTGGGTGEGIGNNNSGNVGEFSTCLDSSTCSQGEYCSASGSCVRGTDATCNSNEDCDSEQICSIYGFCRNPNASSGSICNSNTDCPPRFVCNLDVNQCQIGGIGFGGNNSEGGGVISGESEGASEEVLDIIDDLFTDVVDILDPINDLIENLSEDDRSNVITALEQGLLEDKISGIEDLIAGTDDPAVLEVLERILDGLEALEDLRKELDRLRIVMPESEDSIKAYDEASEALNNLIDDPLNTVKLKRFEKRYRSLKDIIRTFPVVKSVIRAVPASGNVPFTVTLDGLDSIDPMGGTISNYEWSFLDNNGKTVSLGNEPVLVHEFTEANTYSIKLKVSTSRVDSAGFKTAADGISFVRIKANPPTSQVSFRINGIIPTDIYHVTLEEASAGLIFDPSSTVPALGRVIEKYEWLYGDTNSEERTTPTSVVHSYNKVGEFFVTLRVTDNHGLVDRKIIKLFVKSLAADINVSPDEGNVNTEFRFQGVNSRSDDGEIGDYKWEIEDKEGVVVAESEEENFYHIFDKPGEYNISLLITDITGSKDKSLKVLRVVSRPPISSFSYNITDSNHPNKVEFNAINSYDPDQGDNITYSWDFNDDGDFDIVKTNDIRVYYTYNRSGDYRVTLQVEDSFGERNQIQKGVSIKSTLSGDIFLEKRAAKVGDEITFEARSPNAVAYLWEFGDSETSSTEDNVIKYTYNKKGKYKVKLNFFDNDDNDNSDSTYMLIGDRDEPISAVNILVNGRDQGVIDDLCGPNKNGVSVTRADILLLSGKDSINRDGSSRLLSYSWELTDGSRSSRKEFTHKFDEISRADECFKASLVVRDQISGKVSEEDSIYFKVFNKEPTIVDFVIESEKGKELVTPTKVNLKAVTPKDLDGQIKKFRWWYYRDGYQDEKLGVHSTSNGETEIVITAEGQADSTNKYYFVLEVTDNDGGVYNTTERFGEVSYLDVKNGPNLSPVAEFTVDKTTIAVGDSITFVSQSYDPQGDKLPNDAYRWDFDGDGSFDDVSSGSQVNRQFNTPGEYEVRLKISHRGLSSSTSRTIFVEQVDSLPQAAFTYKIDGNKVSFDANNSRFDPNLDDTTLRFEWDFDVFDDDNGNGINDDDIQSSEVNPTFTFDEIRLYRVRLKVKDSLGMEGVVVRDVDLGLSAKEREAATYHSLGVSSPNQPLTSLLVSVSPSDIISSGTSDVTATVLNADNSPYLGKVYFEVIEGSGIFSPNPVDSKEAVASSIFSAIDPGLVKIRVRATDTYYGEVVEDVTINVK